LEFFWVWCECFTAAPSAARLPEFVDSGLHFFGRGRWRSGEVERSRARRSSARHRHISARGGSARTGARPGAQTAQHSARQRSADRIGSVRLRGRDGPAPERNAARSARHSSDRIGTEQQRAQRGMARCGTAQRTSRGHSVRCSSAQSTRLGASAARLQQGPALARRGTVDAAEPRPEGFHEPFCRVEFVQKKCID
jgi:hypothetical protein